MPDIDPESGAELPHMTFAAHLDELGSRSVHSIGSLGIGVFISYIKREKIYGLLQTPITYALNQHHLGSDLIYMNPADGCNLHLNIVVPAGFTIAFPYVLYQVWLFFSPGLNRREKRYVWPFVMATITTFFATVFLGYRFVYPGFLDFLLSCNAKFNPSMQVDKCADRVLGFVLGLGVAFELLIAFLFLSLVGVVSAALLRRNIRSASLGIFVVAALLAPLHDVMTMVICASPMFILYLLSIGVTYIVQHALRRMLRAAY